MIEVFRDLKSFLPRSSTRRRLRAVVEQWSDDFLLVMVVVPNLVHVAIPALRLLVNYGPVLVLSNGLRSWELEWLRRECPTVHVENLLTSGFGSRQRVVAHGETMELIAGIAHGDFGFIDPDCYVFSRDICVKLKAASATSYMAGPFWLENDALGVDVPDTFLLGINRQALAVLKKRYGVKLGVTESLPAGLANDVALKWRQASDIRPHPWKTYYDTVHSVTLAAAVEGLTMGRVTTVPGEISHVCGTSYHNSNFRPPNEQDMYVVNAHYFHLELIKRVRHDRVDQEFAPMERYYGGSEGLLRSNPEYAGSETHHDVRTLLDTLIDHGIV